MSRWIGRSPDHDHIGDVLDASDAWRDRCLMADGSVFGEDALWTIPNIRELRKRVQENPILGTDSTFYDKLSVQLESAQPEVVRLVAETLWFLFLLPWYESMKPETKRAQIREVWRWSGSDLPDSGYLRDSVLKGVANPGPAFHTYRPDELDFLWRTVERWKMLPDPRQREPVLRDELFRRMDNAGVSAEWGDIVRDLDALSETTITYNGKRFAVRSNAVGVAGKIAQCVGVRLPNTVRQIEIEEGNTDPGS